MWRAHVTPDSEGVESGAKRNGSVLVSPVGNVAGNGRPVPTECRSCRFHSTAGDKWKWICSVRTLAWRSKSTACSIWPMSEAYRRDRRKDQLLQENGYFVLRFLAEDVGKNLDLVLDAILRTLSHRRRESSDKA